MAHRRQFLAVLASACGLTPVIAWFASPSPDMTMSDAFPVRKSDDEWRRSLTPSQYQVLRHHSTERPYTSPLNQEGSINRTHLQPGDVLDQELLDLFSLGVGVVDDDGRDALDT